MRTFPIYRQRVKNIKVYPYIAEPPGGGPGPVVFPIISDAEGILTTTYIGVRIQRFTLEIDTPVKPGILGIDGTYQFSAELEDGSEVNIPWLVCENNGVFPLFTRLIVAGYENLTGESKAADKALALNTSPSDYIDFGPLTDISIIKPFGGIAIGFEVLVENGTGELIGTRIGTPHLMGVRVDSGVVAKLKTCDKGLIVRAKFKDKVIHYRDFAVIDPGDPAIFLQDFYLCD